MPECVIFRLDMLSNPIFLEVAEEGLDFGRAKKEADETIEKRVGEAMLLAWYQGKTGEYAPHVPCCSHDQPPWLTYALSRGGTLSVVVNGGAYVFIYRRL